MPQSCHRCIALAAMFGLALAAFTAQAGSASDQTGGADRAAQLTRQLQDVAGDANASATASGAGRRGVLRETLTAVASPEGVPSSGTTTALSSMESPGSVSAALGDADNPLPKISLEPIADTSEPPSAGASDNNGMPQAAPPPDGAPARPDDGNAPLFKAPGGDKAAGPPAKPATDAKDVKSGDDAKGGAVENPAPEPPAPRAAPQPATTDANASLATHLRALIRGSEEGTDPLSKGGVTSGGQTAAKPAADDAAEMAAPPVLPTAPISAAAPVAQPVPTLVPPAAAPNPAPIPMAKTAPLKKFEGDPLNQVVNIDFREMELTNVVALLAQKADINVIAGTDLRGTVTANLRNVTLRQAMETALRMNNLGMIEEEGIYRVVSYEEAVAANTRTAMIKLETAKGEEVKEVLKELSANWPDKANISVTVNKGPNVLLLSAPKARIDELTALVKALDVSKPVLPTVTEAISLNYAEPEEMVKALQKTLTPGIGQVTGDKRSRHLVVTDMPVVIEQVKELIKTLDKPVKQVMIDTMIVDVSLTDAADTGVDWLLAAVRHQSARDAALGGPNIGNLQALGLESNNSVLPTAAGLLNYALLTNNVDWKGVVELEVRNQNGRLLSNPVVMTVENKEAAISISQEIPYTDLSQTSNGGSQTSTRFKDIGTIFTVTPQVTNDNHIIARLEGKESFTNGEFKGVPIEDKRQIASTMRMSTGQTIFIGGLRKGSGTTSIKKIPILGDIPVAGFFFKTNQQTQKLQDLLIFITCNVIEEDVPLTDRQKQIIKDMNPGDETDAWGESMQDYLHPKDNNKVRFKYRRGE